MGKLTTHALDTHHGSPAAGMALRLFRLGGAVPELLSTVTLNTDGRPPHPLLEGAALQPGSYRLEFEVAAYFKRRGVSLPEPPFLDQVALEVGVSDASLSWHVPLLVGPWSYATYRGS